MREKKEEEVEKRNTHINKIEECCKLGANNSNKRNFSYAQKYIQFGFYKHTVLLKSYG